jgi:hypothetical protein
MRHADLPIAAYARCDAAAAAAPRHAPRGAKQRDFLRVTPLYCRCHTLMPPHLPPIPFIFFAVTIISLIVLIRRHIFAIFAEERHFMPLLLAAAIAIDGSRQLRFRRQLKDASFLPPLFSFFAMRRLRFTLADADDGFQFSFSLRHCRFRCTRLLIFSHIFITDDTPAELSPLPLLIIGVYATFCWLILPLVASRFIRHDALRRRRHRLVSLSPLRCFMPPRRFAFASFR